MTGNVVDALEEALYSAMAADVTLLALAEWGGPEYAPDEREYPFIVLRLVDSSVHNTLGARGWWEFVHRFTVYTAQSAQAGPDRPTANAAVARLIEAFDRQRLTVPGYTHIASLVERPYRPDMSVMFGRAYAGVSVDLRTWLE